jgi:hypothetical protein
VFAKNISPKIQLNKTLLFLCGLFLLFGIAYTYLVPSERFTQVSIFSSPQTQLVTNEQIREDQFISPVITRVFHNKITNYTRTIVDNFGQYFTLNFLFLDGGFPGRERIPSSGLLYFWELPFLLVGLYGVFRNKKKEQFLLVVMWLALLLPSAITYDEIPNVHRALIVFPLLTMLIALGIYETYKGLRKLKKVSVILLLLVVAVGLYEFLYFEHQYFVHQNVHQAWYRGAAYQGLIPALQKQYPKFRQIIISKNVGSPYIYILFYEKYNPSKYQREGSPRDLDYSGFDKYLFVPKDCPLDARVDETGKDITKGEKGILYVDAGTCAVPLKKGKLLDTIKWKDGSVAFKLMEYLP